ncbi:hypothetical protein DPMN_029166 [Dreissena polymorpha]|uniref:Uncharacterized protein n=1 Tax=Dreissena polymorpha TaxID=45954 RepID=A0A9D4RG00_DREPO|nr:hypothetical protein DPMN_029166 [Dreissena polymorpha]
MIKNIIFLRERCGFFLAINPDDYRRVIGTPEEGIASDFLKDAIRSWCAKNPRGRSLMDWGKGWRSIRQYSQTKPHVNTMFSVIMTHSGVLAVLWIEDGDYRRVTLSSTVIGQSWKREAIFRRMAVTHTPSDLPPCLNNWTSCEDVPSDRLARCLGVVVDDIVLIEAPLLPMHNGHPVRILFPTTRVSKSHSTLSSEVAAQKRPDT